MKLDFFLYDRLKGTTESVVFWQNIERVIGFISERFKEMMGSKFYERSSKLQLKILYA